MLRIAFPISSSDGGAGGMRTSLPPFRSGPQISKVDASKEIGASCKECLVRGERGVVRFLHQPNDCAMRDRDAFRCAGRSRGVHDVGQIFRAHFGLEFAVVFVSEVLLQSRQSDIRGGASTDSTSRLHALLRENHTASGCRRSSTRDAQRDTPDRVERRRRRPLRIARSAITISGERSIQTPTGRSRATPSLSQPLRQTIGASIQLVITQLRRHQKPPRSQPACVAPVLRRVRESPPRADNSCACRSNSAAAVVACPIAIWRRRCSQDRRQPLRRFGRDAIEQFQPARFQEHDRLPFEKIGIVNEAAATNLRRDRRVRVGDRTSPCPFRHPGSVKPHPSVSGSSGGSTTINTCTSGARLGSRPAQKFCTSNSKGTSS